ncbi:hypothetical protein PAGL106935_15860 [Paenibacillus glucanolyticus]|jgi:hypothetical protein
MYQDANNESLQLFSNRKGSVSCIQQLHSLCIELMIDWALIPIIW